MGAACKVRRLAGCDETLGARRAGRPAEPPDDEKRCMADPTTVDNLLPGDHVCWTFDDHERHLRALSRFLRQGLERGDQVLYLTDTFLPEAFLAAVQAYGVDVTEPRRTGQLQVMNAEDSYLASGPFEPEQALKGWANAIEQARGQGYPGLRVAADMGWTTRPAPGTDRLARYEARVNTVLADGYALALCCYDRRLFTHAELDLVSAAHPGTARAGAGTLAGWAPLLRVRRTPTGLALRGTADHTNRDALAAVVEPLAAEAVSTGGPLVLDVSELVSADLGAARLVAGALAAAGGRLLLQGTRPPLAELLSRTGPDDPGPLSPPA